MIHSDSVFRWYFAYFLKSGSGSSSDQIWVHKSDWIWVHKSGQIWLWLDLEKWNPVHPYCKLVLLFLHLVHTGLTGDKNKIFICVRCLPHLNVHLAGPIAPNWKARIVSESNWVYGATCFE